MISRNHSEQTGFIVAQATSISNSETEHTFWIFGGPFQLPRVRRHPGNFAEWQRSLNEAQRSAVNFVQVFIQQYHLETLYTNPMSLRLNFQTKTLKITFRHSDWWSGRQVKGLEVLRIEFETDVVKKEQLHMVLERAQHWQFLVHDAKAILETDGRVEHSEWVGPADLKHDNTIFALRH
ncbi:hypothetical protein DV736_g6640, partial [Chaetothyriales sp. CBS 134916]